MAFELPPLPYALDALEPHISAETLQFHHGKHHKAYIDKLNALLPGSGFEHMSLEDIVKRATGDVFNNAGQSWNHTFYWQCLRPGGGTPGLALSSALSRAFGSVDEFKSTFVKSAAGNFGSGWTWLVKNRDGSVAVVNTGNAGTPLTDAVTPLLTVDVWEHAYYIDYRNERQKYLESFWNIVNWPFVEENFAR